MNTTWHNPDAPALIRLLKDSLTIAVVGLSPKPHRDSHRIAAYLQDYGFRIVPIRPGLTEALGEPAYPSLSAVPEPLRSQIDLVDVFRAPEHVDAIVDECLALGIKALWLQLGVVNRPAAEKAAAGGMTVVMDRCIYVDYRDLVTGD